MASKIKSTEEMEEELKNIKTPKELKAYIYRNTDSLNESYSEWLDEIYRKKGKTIADVERIGIDEKYFRRLKNGEKTNPSRAYVIRIGLALGVSLEEMNRGLKVAGWKELYVKDPTGTDPIIIKALEQHWSLEEIEEALHDIKSNLTIIS